VPVRNVYGKVKLQMGSNPLPLFNEGKKSGSAVFMLPDFFVIVV
jgi:hypothetical protein